MTDAAVTVTVAVVYHSALGTTARLAAAVAEGIAAVDGARADVHRIEGRDIVEGRFVNDAVLQAVDAARAVVFGAPTFMGGPSAQFKAFADASSERWDAQRWRDKLAAGFTIGGNLNGDQTATLQYFALLAAQHGMCWIGLDIAAGTDPLGRNRLGTQVGASAQTLTAEVPDADLATAHHLGERIARIARAWPAAASTAPR